MSIINTISNYISLFNILCLCHFNIKSYKSKTISSLKRVGKSYVFGLPQNPSIDVRRECILKALCVYLNEEPDNLVKKYMVSYGTVNHP